VVNAPKPQAWATRSLTDALGSGSFAGMAVAQAVLVAAVLVSDVGAAAPFLVLLHVVIAIVLVGGWRRGVAAELLFAVLFAGYAADYCFATQSGGALTSVALWLASVTSATPLVVLPRRRALAVAGAGWIVLTAVPLVRHPGWGTDIALTYAITAGALILAGVALAQVLLSYAGEVDRAWLAAESEHQRVRAARVRARELAEHGRMLHDTVLNTLAAIAAGGAAVSDRRLVSERCRQDVTVVEQLLAGRPAGGLGSFPDASAGFDVEWTGLSAAERERHADGLAPQVLAALRGALGELVRNAQEHSRADHVRIDTALRGGVLLVTVIDDGVGFDLDRISGWGLRESVLSRAREAGIAVTIDSAPGHGTTVSLVVSRGPAPEVGELGPEDDALHAADSVLRTGAWAWAVLVSGAELAAVTVVRTSELAPTLMIGLVAGCCALAWWSCREERALPRWVSGVLVVAVAPALVLDFAGTGHGEFPYLWQAISLTPLLVVLFVLSRTVVPVVLAVGVLVGTAGVVMVREPADAAFLVGAGAAVQLAQFGAWAVFAGALRAIGRRAVADQRRAAEDHLVVAAAEVAEVSRERWTTAGIRRAIELLSAIADDPELAQDPEVRRTCGVEESHLRQLILISPEMLHLGTWFSRALSLARTRGVVLTLRLASADAADAEGARALGGLMLEAIAASPSGASLTVTWLCGSDGAHMMFVGEHGLADSLTSPGAGRPGWSSVVHHYESQDLIELTPIAV